jgi:hypothetical protein
MKIIKIVSSFILILVILWNITVFAKENNITTCIWLKDYELYKCQIDNVCLKQEYGKSTEKVVKILKYYEKAIETIDTEEETTINEWFENNIINIGRAKQSYRENQNNIYKCWVINSQFKVFSKIQKILNSTDKTGVLKERLVSKLEQKKEKLVKISEKYKCLISNENSNKTQFKKIVLDQSTLELCNYRYYLYYLYNRSKDNLEDSFPKWKEYISFKETWKEILKKQNEIQNEIKHSFKMYPLAFDSYIQYDSFLKLHIVLELLKEDYRVFRDKLYLTLHPINQVVYKIINAQSK